ncbi:MAG: hypothetical protein ABI600_04780 [Luteolibacter sp.]
MNQIDLVSSDESPRQGWWAKKSKNKIPDSVGGFGLEYQLMYGTTESGYAKLGEAERMKLEKYASSKNVQV